MADAAAITLTGLLKKAAAAFPSRRAVAVPGKIELTHAALDALVDAAAARLAADGGVLPGHVVALSFPNTVELVIMFLAVIRARAVAAPLDPGYTQEQFEFYLSDSKARLLLTNVEGNAAAQAAAAKLGLAHAAADLHDAAGPVHLAGLNQAAAENGSTDSSASSPPDNEASDVALFLHTSGTTSRPKGVALTQSNLAASVQNIRSVYRLVETDATVVVLPLFHVHGLLCALLSSLASGAAVTLPAAGRFSASTFWADMIRAKATWYTAVPTIHQIILDRHASKPEAEYPKLRFVRSCSASLAPAILEKLEAAFGAPVLEAYAMTEASHLMTSNPLPQDGARKPGSVGRPVGQEMAILDEDGKLVEPGKPGEVCIRGANVTRGYKNPEANEAAFRFGWFHTGAIGFVDEEGYLHLVGRIKELSNRGGEKISPTANQAVSFAVPDEVVIQMDTVASSSNEPPVERAAATQCDRTERALHQSVVDMRMMEMKIHMNPASIRALGQRFTTPTVVAIGPYHHGTGDHLKTMEEVKQRDPDCYIKSLGSHSVDEVYQKVFSVAEDARSLYDDKEAVKGISVHDFARMMFHDACFLVHYMLYITGDLHKVNPSLCKIFESRDEDILQDIILLENQLPWLVVETVMDFIPVPLDQFILLLGNRLHGRRFSEETPLLVLDGSYKPPHLLGLLRFDMIRMKKLPTLAHIGSGSADISINKLAEIGINLEANKTNDLKDTGFFKKGFLFADLYLEPLSLDASQILLINMAAHELCVTSNFQNAEAEYSAVCSYLQLIAMLVRREEDVRELRTKRILKGVRFNDKQAFDFFSSLHDLRLGSLYLNTTGQIEDYMIERQTRNKVYAFFYRNWETAKVLFVFGAIASILRFLQPLVIKSS